MSADPAASQHGAPCQSAGSGRPSIARLVKRRFLDPRPATEARAKPIRNAVNIPLEELPARTHELPSRSDCVEVVGPKEWVYAALSWLREHDRGAVAVPSFEWETGPEPDVIGRLWRPAAFLEQVAQGLQPGTALDLACGTGRDAVYLASLGWQVTAVDVLPDALDRARDLERRYGLGPPVRWVQADLESDPPKLPRFDLVTMFRFLHRPLAARLADWLHPGGSLLCETFTTLHRHRHGRPASDEHVLKPGELRTLFREWELRHDSEGWRGVNHTARLWVVCRG